VSLTADNPGDDIFSCFQNLFKIKTVSFFFVSVYLFSCVGQGGNLYYPVPDSSQVETERNMGVENIVDTRDGHSVDSLPEWLTAFLTGGTGAVEQLAEYQDKYVFIGINENNNLAALNRWGENFTAMYDFPVLAAARIERRMFLSASLYPDDEYGAFFEVMIKNAFSAEYEGTVKEDVFWVKLIEGEDNREIYRCFILLIIDKSVMQVIIRNLMAQSYTAVTITAAQIAAVTRLRQFFFNGF